MKKIFKKYGKHAASLALLSVILVLPLAAGAAINTSDITKNLDLTAGQAGIQGGTTDLPTVVGNILKVIIGMLGVLLVLLIVYAGFTWMTASGDAKKVETAKDRIKQAIIGLILIFAAYAITNFVIYQMTTVAG